MSRNALATLCSVGSLLAAACAGCASGAPATRPAAASAPHESIAPAAQAGERPSGAADTVAPAAPAPRIAESIGGRMLLPPADHGASKTQVVGCLAETGEQGAARFPAKPVVRGGPPPVSVNPTGYGVIVTHDLSHACCLHAAVTTRVDGRQVRIVEKLDGEPCRCMCSSTLKTAVGLRPGEYELVLAVERAGNVDEVHRAPLEVRGLER